MDDVDRANEQNELFREVVIRNRPSVRPTPEGIGECLYCKDAVKGTRRWCSPLCRDEWEADHNDRM